MMPAVEVCYMRAANRSERYAVDQLSGADTEIPSDAMETFMNSGLNWLVAIIMAVALSACATGGSSPSDTAGAQSDRSAAAADKQPSSKPVVSTEPECD